MTDTAYCAVPDCPEEGTEKLGDRYVCPAHLQAAFDREYERQKEHLKIVKDEAWIFTRDGMLDGTDERLDGSHPARIVPRHWDDESFGNDRYNRGEDE